MRGRFLGGIRRGQALRIEPVNPRQTAAGLEARVQHAGQGETETAPRALAARNGEVRRLGGRRSGTAGDHFRANRRQLAKPTRPNPASNPIVAGSGTGFRPP